MTTKVENLSNIARIIRHAQDCGHDVETLVAGDRDIVVTRIVRRDKLADDVWADYVSSTHWGQHMFQLLFRGNGRSKVSQPSGGHCEDATVRDITDAMLVAWRDAQRQAVLFGLRAS